jgi:hypothetical protein
MERDIIGIDATVNSFLAARTAVSHLQGKAGDIYQILAKARRIDHDTASTLKIIALYGESIDLLLLELANQVGVKLGGD